MPAEFIPFSSEHLLWLGFAAISTLALVWVTKRLNSAQQERVAFWLAWLCPLIRVITTALLAPMENWDLQLILPLHLCYFLPFLMSWLLTIQLLAIFLFSLVYIPYFIADRKSNERAKELAIETLKNPDFDN